MLQQYSTHRFMHTQRQVWTEVQIMDQLHKNQAVHAHYLRAEKLFVHLRTRFGDCRFKDGQNLTLFGDWREALDACRWDAQVIVEWEALAVQHLRPGEAERGHHGRAAVLDALAQRPARLYGLVQVVQAHGGEEGAEELSSVGVTLLLHQRDPRRRLLQNLVHGFVPEQVREAHLRVLDVVAQQQVWRDRLAVVLLVV